MRPLHTLFSTKMDEILEEIRSLREIIQSLQPSQPPDSLCEGVTGKGTQCRNRASPDSCYCRMHLGRRVERVAKVSRGVKKVKKIQPEHTHGVGVVRRVVRVGRETKKLKKIQPEHTHEGGILCKLCETHGDVWDPGLVGVGFEGCVEI